ncbi:tetratricopeptide repeat tpr [Lasius niger]|uniref:Tetratricopeptide repeat tpr n=1 Tax=Lasius niger TaxID=67767 RepID=A0A0J7KDF0_LASNI|nr:tetratricopeptide repeat tpr [Lasius niger]
MNIDKKWSLCIYHFATKRLKSWQKFVELYDENVELILQRRKKFKSDLDIQKTIEICRQSCREEEDVDDNAPLHDLVARQAEPDPLQQLYNDENSDINRDLRLAIFN